MTAPNREFHFAAGEMLLVDKPRGWTSFDVVNKIRHLFQVKKVGHAGTLDPMATGLLIVCTGAMTKQIDSFMGMEKEYDAEMTLGATTPSFDAETEVNGTASTEGVTEARIRDVLAQFVGRSAQIPPMWSALKVDGQRLYKLARKGKVVERTPREIEISSIVPVAFRIPVVRFRVVCSKGTYIRTLVNDIGAQLECGAFLSALIRTRIGTYSLEDAMSVDDLIALREARGAIPA
jgi:tRNA pseudouridine55 synthase